MKKFIPVFLIILLIIAGCRHNEQSISKSEINTYYEKAMSPLRTAQDFSLKIQKSRIMVHGNQNFSEVSSQIVLYQGWGTSDLTYQISEVCTIGTHSIESVELFQNGIQYLTINGSSFGAPVGTQDPVASLVPPILLDNTLYRETTAHKIESGYSLLFFEPTGAEEWALPQGASFQNAEGTIEVTKEGTLLKSTYRITYIQEGIPVTEEYAVEAGASSSQIMPPKDYTMLENLNTVKQLERACGYLIQAENIQASALDTIVCQVGGIRREQVISLVNRGVDAQMDTTLTTQVQLTDQSRGNETTSYTQTERFSNGQYTISVEGSSPDDGQNRDSQHMRAYYQDILVSPLPLPVHIRQAQSERNHDGTVTLRFELSDDMGELLCQESCQTLYQDPYLLLDAASEYDMTRMECSLTLSGVSGLPLRVVLEYTGLFTIEGINYELQISAQYNYTLQ